MMKPIKIVTDSNSGITQKEGEALKFSKEIEAEFPNMKVLCVDPLSLSVACHTGAGALGMGICFYDSH